MFELQEIFENAVLTDDTKTVLKEAFSAAVAAKEVLIREEYEKQIADEITALTNSAQTMVEEAVADHLAEFADEIAHARTLDVQYAERLEIFKESYAEKTDELTTALIAECIASEIYELREEIEEAKKVKFALNLVESFGETYAKLFGGEETVSALDELKEAKQELDVIKRKQKISELVESLQGSKRKVAETVLEGVAFDKLEARFESIKPLLITEAVVTPDPVVEESANGSNDNDKKPAGTVVIEENVQHEPEVSEKAKLAAARIQKSLKVLR